MSGNIENDDFDALSYVKNIFSNHSESEIRSTMDKINTKIIKTKNESKMVVKKHFNKFIQCVLLIDKLKSEDLLSAAKVAKRYEKLTDKYLESFKKHVENAKIDSKEQLNELKRDKIKKKYSILFDLKESLDKYFENGDYKSFTETYMKAKFIAVKSNSEYLMDLFESVKSTKIRFLNKMAEIIENPDSSIEEISDAFKYYFKIEGGDKSFAENTLLVNIKYLFSKFLDDYGEIIPVTENDTEISENDDKNEFKNYDLNFLDDLGVYLVKLLKFTDSFFIEKQIIDIFFEKIMFLVHYGVNYKIFLIKVRRIGSDLKDVADEDVRIYFMNCIEKVEDLILGFLWRDFEEIVVRFLNMNCRAKNSYFNNDLDYLLKESFEMGISRDKIKKLSISCLKNMTNPSSSQTIRKNLPEFVENTYKLRNNFSILRGKFSKYGIDIDIEDIEINFDKILKIAIEKLLFKENDSYLLMLATKIIFFYPLAHKDIFKKSTEKFGNSKVVLNYLGNLLGKNGDNKKTGLDKQFSFLRKMNK
ncbi:hypothetical protein DMUE_0916 [Dictyocoela muelleri]|nr:hypothetical protein DMUE_0916 [Dictyocoela muelleri]